MRHRLCEGCHRGDVQLDGDLQRFCYKCASPVVRDSLEFACSKKNADRMTTRGCPCRCNMFRPVDLFPGARRGCNRCLEMSRVRRDLKRKTPELTAEERNLVYILSDQAGSTLLPADVAMLGKIKEKEVAKLDAAVALLDAEEASLATSSRLQGNPPLLEAAVEKLSARRRVLDADRGWLLAETADEKEAARVEQRDAEAYEEAAKQLWTAVKRAKR